MISCPLSDVWQLLFCGGRSSWQPHLWDGILSVKQTKWEGKVAKIPRHRKISSLLNEYWMDHLNHRSNTLLLLCFYFSSMNNLDNSLSKILEIVLKIVLLYKSYSEEWTNMWFLVSHAKYHIKQG